MTRRFSSQELTFLRNQVPISHVIETLLGRPVVNADGRMRFACPACRAMDTSINTDHNLLKCFDCRQNFNPIELVMHQLHISFVDSVKWLKSRAVSVPVSEQRPNTDPVAIGQMLSDMLPELSDEKTDHARAKSIPQRISHLEKSIQHLHQLINELRSSLDHK
jgi:hypothetical protein